MAIIFCNFVYMISRPEENQQHSGNKKRVRFFTSVQQQEEELIAYWASITPLQRLRHLHEMIIHSYGLTEEKLKNPQLSRSLTIKYYKP
jgi:hypothetical protein